MRRAIRSNRVVTGTEERPATVVFEDGTILGVEDHGIELGSMPVLELGDLCLLPGLVDTHVHINDPGRSDWEGFSTASRAAAAGGYTCVVDMPLNSVPATTDLAALEQKRRASQGICLVDHAFWGGVVPANSGDIIPLARAGVRGFKSFLVDSGVAEFSMVHEQDLRIAMPLIAQTGLPLLVHAEDPTALAEAQRTITGDARSYAFYLRSRPDAAEVTAIERMIRLSREFGCRIHIVHVASADAVPALRRARDEGLPITAETCPHYLYFAAEDIPDGATQFKCAPPIRGRATRELLWEALREGVLDLIATDHSPCPPAMKRLEDGDFLEAWGGVASLSLALPVIWTAASERGFRIENVVRWMSEKTASLAGLDARKGRLMAGRDADFVVFDPDAAFTVQPSDLHFRHAVSPYLGETIRGRVLMTFLRGFLAFEHGKFIGDCRGRECRVSEWSNAS